MKKVLLIARAKTEESKQKADAFADKVRRKLEGLAWVENCEISELFFEIDNDHMSIYHPQKRFDIREFDLVIIRHIGAFSIEAHAITLYCEHFGIRYTDTYLNRLLLDNKVSTEFLLWVNDIKRLPRTFYGPTEELVRRLPELGERAIFKDNEGSKGRLNFVVHSGEDIWNIVNDNPGVHFLLQEFIPNDGDLRVLIMNDRPVMVIKRTSDGSSHLNNTSQGGQAEVLDNETIDGQILDISIKSAQVTKLQVAGVDIVTSKDTGEFYILEINNAPQVSSGSFQEEKSNAYVEMIKDLLEK